MAVNKVIYSGDTLIDLTGDTVTADKLLAGYTAHDRSGTLIAGTYNPFKPQIIVVTEDNNYVRATALRGGTVLSGRATGGAYVFDLPSYDTWEIEASLNSSFAQSQSTVVIVNTVKQYVVKLSAVPDFASASWADIKTIVTSGAAASAWSIGDTRLYYDTGGTSHTVEIVNVSDNSMILDLVTPYYTGTIFIQTGPTSGYMSTWASTTFLNSLPTDFKNVVSSCGYFSTSELFGGSPLALFSTADGRAKGFNWWTGTYAYQQAAPYYTYYYYYVTTSGAQGQAAVNSYYYHNPKITIS